MVFGHEMVRDRPGKSAWRLSRLSNRSRFCCFTHKPKPRSFVSSWPELEMVIVQVIMWIIACWGCPKSNKLGRHGPFRDGRNVKSNSVLVSRHVRDTPGWVVSPFQTPWTKVNQLWRCQHTVPNGHSTNSFLHLSTYSALVFLPNQPLLDFSWIYFSFAKSITWFLITSSSNRFIQNFRFWLLYKSASRPNRQVKFVLPSFSNSSMRSQALYFFISLIISEIVPCLRSTSTIQWKCEGMMT